MSRGPNSGKVTGNRASSKPVKLTELQKVLMGKGMFSKRKDSGKPKRIKRFEKEL